MRCERHQAQALLSAKGVRSGRHAIQMVLRCGCCFVQTVAGVGAMSSKRGWVWVPCGVRVGHGHRWGSVVWPCTSIVGGRASHGETSVDETTTTPI